MELFYQNLFLKMCEINLLEDKHAFFMKVY